MKNKSGVIVKTLIEKMKKNTHFFGDLTVVEKHGKYCSRADITMQAGDKTEVYRVIVIKHAN